MENEDFHFQYQFSSEDEKAKYDEAYETLYNECQKNCILPDTGSTHHLI